MLTLIETEGLIYFYALLGDNSKFYAIFPNMINVYIIKSKINSNLIYKIIFILNNQHFEGIL